MLAGLHDARDTGQSFGVWYREHVVTVTTDCSSPGSSRCASPCSMRVKIRTEGSPCCSQSEGRAAFAAQSTIPAVEATCTGKETVPEKSEPAACIYPVDDRSFYSPPSFRNLAEAPGYSFSPQGDNTAMLHSKSEGVHHKPASKHTIQMPSAVQQSATSQVCESQFNQHEQQSCTGKQSGFDSMQQVPSAQAMPVFQHRRMQSSSKVSASILRIARRIMREDSSSCSSDDETRAADEEAPTVRGMLCTGSSKAHEPAVLTEKERQRGTKSENRNVQANSEMHASMLCASCRSPVDVTIRQYPRSSPQSPVQHRSRSPNKGQCSPHSKARAERVRRVSSTLDGLKDRSRKVQISLTVRSL
jgi:hypothetical protein